MLRIFSDESGSVHNENEKYFVRSFIFITEKKYQELSNRLDKIKEENGIRGEIKFKQFKSRSGRYEPLLDIDFNAYLCFTNISEDIHHRENPYKVLTYVLDSLKKCAAKHPDQVWIIERLKPKVKAAFNSICWPKWYEQYYYQVSQRIIEDIYKAQDYKYFIDKPQFHRDDYKKMLKNCGIEKYKIIEESENCPGIQLADIFAGSLADVLKNWNTKEHYDYIREKLLGESYTDEYKPNPNKVFYNKNNDVKYNVLLSRIWINLSNQTDKEP